ncbi:MAG: anthranilate phosphoribosyltransferase [Deinococcales bacterium]
MSTAAISIATLLNQIFDGKTLNRQEAREVVGHLMDGKLSQMQAAALLAALRMRGETVEEIIGFAEAMRERAIKVQVKLDEPLLDIVGTGGTGINTFNISTASMFVTAAAGAKVAKHGNRGVTRKSGSADVLEALGINIDMSVEQLAEALESLGIAFIYARSHHPAMKFVAPIRADIQARTIFNSLGPLTNPANATRQLMGCYDAKLTESLAKVLSGLGLEHALVVHGAGLDELSVCGTNIVSEYKDGQVNNYQLAPEDLNLNRYPLEDILGASPQDNAKTIRKVLKGEIGGAKRDIICLNAGAGLYLAGKALDIQEGIKLAQDCIDDGKAYQKLEAYVAYSQA